MKKALSRDSAFLVVRGFLSIDAILAEDAAEVESAGFFFLTGRFFRLVHGSDEFLAAAVDAFAVGVAVDRAGASWY